MRTWRRAARGSALVCLLVCVAASCGDTNNIDAQRDIIFTKGPVDQLDHAAPLPNFGSKMGIDATAKWPSEGYQREWPPEIVMDPAIKAQVDRIWTDLGL